MTERRQWEDDLRDSEAKFKTLAEKTLVGIGMLQGVASMRYRPDEQRGNWERATRF